MRQISTRICVSGEHFGKAIFFAHERHSNTVLPEYAGLCQNKLWRVKRRVLLFMIQSIVYDHLKEKIVK